LVEFGAKNSKSRSSAAMQGIAKLTFMTGIAAAILFAWQGIALHVQKFSVRPDTTPVATTVVRWVHEAWNLALRRPEPFTEASDPAFAAEFRMSASQLVNRWVPVIGAASERFHVPARWIRAVVQMESGGRTMSGAHQPITSRAGAMGVMQLMPGTYRQMSAQYRLGANPYNPHDNIFAGAAYLHWLFRKYGYPAMFAAYNDGPGHLEERLMGGKLLPDETRNYVHRIVATLGRTGPASDRIARFTRPNGTKVAIEPGDVRSVRMALPGEYAADVQTVITVGGVHQAVRESYGSVKAELIADGALGTSLDGIGGKFAAIARTDRNPGHHAARHRREPHATGAQTLAAASDTDEIRLRPISHRAHGHTRA
jgi:membrane-bound lytic murein transglycosylase B